MVGGFSVRVKSWIMFSLLGGLGFLVHSLWSRMPGYTVYTVRSKKFLVPLG